MIHFSLLPSFLLINSVFALFSCGKERQWDAPQETSCWEFWSCGIHMASHTNYLSIVFDCAPFSWGIFEHADTSCSTANIGGLRNTAKKFNLILEDAGKTCPINGSSAFHLTAFKGSAAYPKMVQGSRGVQQV